MLSGAGTSQDRGGRSSNAAKPACNDRDFRRPRANKASGFRSVRGHRGLRKRLQHAKALVEALPATGQEYAYGAPRVGPDLKVWAVPQFGEDSVRALGLSLPRNSQNRSRTGLKGITPHGKKQIRWSCRLLEGDKRHLAMWTVSLTDEDYISLADTCKWPNFQRRVIDLLVRYLKANGDAATVIAVCEVGSKRFARTGRPDPHIHVITSGWGRRRPDGQWLLNPAAMDDLVAKACQYAGLPLRERPAASQIAQVRHSVASYMSKYLTKEMPVAPEGLPGEWQSLIPRQWWSQSESCRALVQGCLIKLSPAFASFVIRQQRLLEGLALGKGGLRTVGYKKGKCYDTPIELFQFVFRTPETLESAIELFALWVVNEERLDLTGLVLSG